jgi:hypothetical protein
MEKAWFSQNRLIASAFSGMSLRSNLLPLQWIASSGKERPPRNDTICDFEKALMEELPSIVTQQKLIQ